MSDETTVHFPRKLVKQFILLYKELECLWNRDCVAYKIKMKRHQAITQLSQLVQTYDPAATRVHILRKIDSLRACVRREYKKVKESRLLATCEEEIYVPTLWYYHLFSFLMEHEDNKGKVEVLRARPHSPELIAESSHEEEEEEDSEDPQSDDIKPEPTYEADCEIEYKLTRAGTSNRLSSREEPRRKRTRPRGSDGPSGLDDEYDAIGSDGPSGLDDEYDAIGINVAAKLRYLPENMRILAEKLISDVLFQAQTNGLTAATVLVTPDPFH